MTNLQRPPAPKGSPLLGHLNDYRKDTLGFLEGIAQKHGDAVRLRVLDYEFYLLSHPRLIEEVLVTKAKNFIKSKDYRNELSFLGNGLITSEGSFWLRQRRLAQPAFHRQRISAYGETMVNYAERLLTSWEDGAKRDIHEDMMGLTLEIAAKTLFHVDIADEAKDVGEAVEVFMNSDRTHVPLWQLLLPKSVPTPTSLRFKRANREMDRLVYGLIAERRRDYENGNGDKGDLMSMLMRTQDADTLETMTDQQLRDELLSILMAGHETTANALSWTWMLLAQHPHVEAKLHAELDEVLGGRAPTLQDLPRLRYTEQIIKESMRVYPPVWGVGREALEDCDIGGYLVPKGMQISISQWLVHRDKRFFEDAKTFRPERWVEGFEKSLPKYAYFPFGGGPRLCIGNNFAMMEAVLLLATLAQGYSLGLTHPQEVTLQPTITLRPKRGIKVRLRARVPANVEVPA